MWKFAGEFIKSGKTLEEKQNRLNAACTAWNIDKDIVYHTRSMRTPCYSNAELKRFLNSLTL